MPNATSSLRAAEAPDHRLCLLPGFTASSAVLAGIGTSSTSPARLPVFFQPRRRFDQASSSTAHLPFLQQWKNDINIMRPPSRSSTSKLESTVWHRPPSSYSPPLTPPLHWTPLASASLANPYPPLLLHGVGVLCASRTGPFVSVLSEHNRNRESWISGMLRTVCCRWSCSLCCERCIVECEMGLLADSFSCSSLYA